MKKIVLASNSEHKIIEFRHMLKNAETLTMKEVGFIQDIEEDGKSFFENALIKAKTIYNYLKDKGIDAIVVADDSGLCVNSLKGAPGIYSARYSGEHGNSAQNRKLLLENLKNKEDRSAYFCCCIVAMFPNGKYVVSEGKTYGSITKTEIGDTGFGYDCVFYSTDLQKTFGEASEEEKNRVSHRGRALENIINKII